MIAWTIAGSDSGGGAGIQADLRTFHGLGVHGCSVITALTAQNTAAVNRAESVQPDMIQAQLDALAADLPPNAIKTGMLPDATTIRLVARALAAAPCPVICDPVMVATSGGRLMEPEAKTALIQDLLPKVDLVTPNLIETEALTGINIQSPDQAESAARRILEFGVKSVLIKGGHGDGAFSQDYWTDGERAFWLTVPRIETRHTHGSGCTLSAAITAALALGHDPSDALVIAKAYISAAIRRAKPIGAGSGPVHQGGWPESPPDMPWLTFSARAGLDRPLFPGTGAEPLGFYPIVDRVSWMARLLPLGVRTIQLRIKDLTGDALDREIAAAAALAKRHGARLFINDFWRLALRHGAYGVHLGQEDLETADIAALAKAGIRLGLSTHCYYEVARALAIRPSYLAIGPIYETTIKAMKFGPQGSAMLRRWRKSLDYPLVAIGGINLERAKQVLAAGADSIAVITAISQASDPEEQTRVWLRLFQDQEA